MKRLHVLSLISIIAILIVMGCNSEYSGYSDSEFGVKYKFHTDVEGETALSGDYVTMAMSYGPKDSLIFNSYDTPQPEIEMPLPESQYEGDIYDCIKMMSAGDSATFIINADSFFIVTTRSPKIPEFMEPNSDLYFNVKISKIVDAEQFAIDKEEELANLKANEQTFIDNYVKENDIKVKPDEDGIYFIEHKKGRRKFIEGQVITMNYSLKQLSGEVIFNSQDRGEPIALEYGQKMDTEGFLKSLEKMRVGSKVTLIVPSAVGFGERGAPQGMIGPYTPLVYELEVLNCEPKADYEANKAKEQEEANKRLEQEEVTKIQQFLKDNNVNIEPTASGLIYIETLTGDGAPAQAGDSVFVHYTLTNFENDTIDESFKRGKPLNFIIDKPGMISGWNEAVKYMKVGGKARAIVPSKLGYGPRGRGQTIPPFTPLVFDLELVEVYKK